jgi:type II secretory pathway pseudopilin PulG
MMVFRRAFTILEIIIVLGLVGAVGFFGVGSLRGLIAQYKFLANGENCYELFRELQLQALTLESDIQVHLCKYRDWEIHVHSEESYVSFEKIVIKNIENVFIDGVEKQEFVFTIFSTGRIDPGVLIKFVGAKGAFFLDFRKPILIKYSLCRGTDAN